MELVYASREGDIEKVRCLLNSGIQVDFRDSFRNCTSLIWASYKGHLEIVDLLLQYGAEVDARDDSKETALMWAAIMTNNLDVIELLIKKGADVNSKDKSGKTVLMLASEVSDLKTVRFLVDRGADVNEKYLGETCIQLSYDVNRIRFVRYFLCLEQLDKTNRDSFLNNASTNDKKELTNYIQSINKIKQFRNRVKRYSSMCGITPKRLSNFVKLVKNKDFGAWWYSPEAPGGKRHLENMKKWFSVTHGL